MHSINISTRVDTDKLKSLPKKLIGNVQKAINLRIAKASFDSIQYIKSTIEKLAPIRTGDLRSRIKSIPVITKQNQGFDILVGKSGHIKVTLSLHSKKFQKILWVNNGTGIYGPSGEMIKPRHAKFLVFEMNGKWWVLKRVKGQRGQHFIERGISESKLIVYSKIKAAFKKT